MLNGVTTAFIERVQVGNDAFNSPVYEPNETVVENVLINTVAGVEQTNTDDYNGKKQTISICVPKDDTHVWEGGKILWRGHWYNIVGFPKEGDDDKLPLAWNKIYTGERYE